MCARLVHTFGVFSMCNVFNLLVEILSCVAFLPAIKKLINPNSYKFFHISFCKSSCHVQSNKAFYTIIYTHYTRRKHIECFYNVKSVCMRTYIDMDTNIMFICLKVGFFFSFVQFRIVFSASKHFFSSFRLFCNFVCVALCPFRQHYDAVEL